jgi:hypothetical protein
MEVGKLEIEGSVAAFPLDVIMRQHPKQRPSCYLTTAVLIIINCVWIAKKVALMKCKHICNERLSTRIRFVPLCRSQRTLIFQDNNRARQGSVCQRYCSVSMELE